MCPVWSGSELATTHSGRTGLIRRPYRRVPRSLGAHGPAARLITLTDPGGVGCLTRTSSVCPAVSACCRGGFRSRQPRRSLPATRSLRQERRSASRADAMEGLAPHCARSSGLRRASRDLRRIEWSDQVRDELTSYRGALSWLIEQVRSVGSFDVWSGLMVRVRVRAGRSQRVAWGSPPRRLPFAAVVPIVILGCGSRRRSSFHS